jgi:hypothetical protein
LTFGKSDFSQNVPAVYVGFIVYLPMVYLAYCHKFVFQWYCDAMSYKLWKEVKMNKEQEACYYCINCSISKCEVSTK